MEGEEDPLAGADAAVHLVGIIVESGGSGGTFAAVHVEGTRRVLEAARDTSVRRLVHMSAVGARPDTAATLYHRTKWQAEELVRSSGLSAAIFRPSLINGPENAPVRTLARAHRWSPVVPVFGDGRFPTQPVWIEDVAQAEQADDAATWLPWGAAGTSGGLVWDPDEEEPSLESSFMYDGPTRRGTAVG